MPPRRRRLANPPMQIAGRYPAVYRRGRPPAKRRSGLAKGALTAPSVHSFVRTATYSNSNNMSVDGVQLIKGANAMTFFIDGIGPVIQYGSGACYFSLDALPQFSEITTLFDSYQLDKVKIRFTPFFGTPSVGAAVSATSGQSTLLFHSVVDHDDSALFSATDAGGLDDMRQYKSYKTQKFINGSPITRTLVPRAAMPAYQAGAFNAYTRAPLNTWYDCSFPAVQFYGLKFIIEGNMAGGSMYLYLKVEVKTKFSCKDVR